MYDGEPKGQQLVKAVKEILQQKALELGLDIDYGDQDVKLFLNRANCDCPDHMHPNEVVWHCGIGFSFVDPDNPANHCDRRLFGDRFDSVDPDDVGDLTADQEDK